MQEGNSSKNNISPNSCNHEAKYLHEMKHNFSICFHCSSIIYTNEIGKKIFPVKPKKYNASQESATPIFISLNDTHRPYRFYNKESYLKIRTKIVKKMKIFAQNYNLTKKTFFLSLNYFDRICSRAIKFNIADFTKLSLGPSNNYTKDELYVLQLLNYDLYAITPYDILMDIMHTGFLFNNENFSINKMNAIYGKMEKMIYFFSEKKYYIEMTPIEIALAVIGFIREALGLVAYNNIIQQIFMTQINDLKTYSDCLFIFKKCFQIQEDSNHSVTNNSNKTDKNNNLLIESSKKKEKFNSDVNSVTNN